VGALPEWVRGVSSKLRLDPIFLGFWVDIVLYNMLYLGGREATRLIVFLI